MPRGRIFGNHDLRRLRLMLAGLFLALAVPTAVVIFQAYDQLKWEAFHLYRGQAEEFTARVDGELQKQVAIAEARGFADYAFLNVSGAPATGFVQRSPLAAYPVIQDLPGVIGYFQVDPGGRFSTPLLPDPGTDPDTVGINTDELQARNALSLQIRQILADNDLVADHAGLGRGSYFADQERTVPPGSALAASDAAKPAIADARLGEESTPAAAAPAGFSQQAFDRLNQSPAESAAMSESRQDAAAREEAPFRQFRKVGELELDEALQQKSETLEQSLANEGEKKRQSVAATELAQRTRRVEQSVLPAPLAAAEPEAAGGAGTADNVRITAFESEVDPYEFSLLGSGHLVLFRKVWRDGERYIQGLLIDRDAFLSDAIGSPFDATALAAMCGLVVGFNDDVLRVQSGAGPGRDGGKEGAMAGALLYRSRLSAPFNALQLIYSVHRLPPGPGAAVLAWTTLILAVVFLGGFFVLYRLGVGQIRLARQQQDFVSAVSHELKTPLTSIRMYAEMLREGWADDGKRKHYYGYIHDESERLSRLISNVLQLARINRDELPLDLQPINAGDLLDEVHAKIADQVERAGFELACDADAAARRADLRIDRDCFAQIVINLVDNAIKFSKDAQVRRIEIHLEAGDHDRVRFRVRDYGPGIPRDQLRKIFRMFYRAESELTRETVGTGIGLAIVHQLTTAMGGSVDVLNRKPGVEFSLNWPVRHAGWTSSRAAP